MAVDADVVIADAIFVVIIVLLLLVLLVLLVLLFVEMIFLVDVDFDVVEIIVVVVAATVVKSVERKLLLSYLDLVNAARTVKTGFCKDLVKADFSC